MELFYFGARYYDPEIGVWGAVDPADQYWYSYSYCGSDPINLIDPDGESALLAGMFIGMGVGAIAGGAYGYATDRENWGWYALGGGIFGGIVGAGIGSAIDWANAPIADASGLVKDSPILTYEQKVATANLPSSTPPSPNSLPKVLPAGDDLQLKFQYGELNLNPRWDPPKYLNVVTPEAVKTISKIVSNAPFVIEKVIKTYTKRKHILSGSKEIEQLTKELNEYWRKFFENQAHPGKDLVPESTEKKDLEKMRNIFKKKGYKIK